MHNRKDQVIIYSDWKELFDIQEKLEKTVKYKPIL